MRERKNADDEKFWIIKPSTAKILELFDANFEIFLFTKFTICWWGRWRHGWEMLMNFDKNKFSFFSRAFRSLTIQVLLFIWAVILWRPIVRHWTTMKYDEGEQVYSSTLSIMKYSYDKLLKNSFSCFVVILVIGNTSFNLCGGSWQLEHGEKQEKVHWARQRQCEKGRLSRIIIFRTRIIFCLICLFTCEKWAASLDFVHLSWITSGFKAFAEDENFFL